MAFCVIFNIEMTAAEVTFNNLCLSGQTEIEKKSIDLLTINVRNDFGHNFNIRYDSGRVNAIEIDKNELYHIVAYPKENNITCGY